MNKLYLFCITLISILFVHNNTYAQENDNMVNTAVLHADARLAVMVRKHRFYSTAPIHSGRGYRVQIYNGNDRNKATNIKIDFMRRFPGVRTYLTYVSPHFRVKVGDYRSRQEAQRIYEQVKAFYAPCMIVPDIIVINTLKDD